MDKQKLLFQNLKRIKDYWANEATDSLDLGGLIVDNNYPRYVTGQAIDALVKKLDLPELDEYCQDWEYEVSNSSRVNEFLEFYKDKQLNIEEKFALMIVIVSSFDDFILEKDFDSNVWNKIKELLIRDLQIHMNTVIYWAKEGEELENCFAVTPFMREIRLEL